MLPTIGGVYVSWIYMLILDISCQHLGDECKLEGFCVPFGHRVGECTFLKIYICIEYMLPTMWGVYVSWKYMLILDISCQHLGDECKLEDFCWISCKRFGKYMSLEFYIFVLDICCQQLREYISVGYIWRCTPIEGNDHNSRWIELRQCRSKLPNQMPQQK